MTLITIGFVLTVLGIVLTILSVMAKRTRALWVSREIGRVNGKPILVMMNRGEKIIIFYRHRSRKRNLVHNRMLSC